MLLVTRPKHVAERDYFGFDFARWPLPAGVTVTSAVFTVSVLEGVDPDASAMKSGGAVVSGTRALQFLIGGVADVRYLLRADAVTSDGRTLTETMAFWVRESEE